VSKLTHLDDDGRARMVDVSDKPSTAREALAAGRIVMQPQTLALALSGQGKKGEVMAVAQIAGIMASKRTSDLIPMCHPLAISSVEVQIDPSTDGSGLEVTARVKTTGPTGVEMEALTAASVALLTLYDMLKAADKAMVVEAVRLIEKSGGASGDFRQA
jgi:cyclic pyranopterin phosphate synthase